MGNTDWITKLLCPLLGTIICNVMWASPLKVVLEARKTRNLNKINPLPFSLIVVNCIGWLIFSIMKHDYFIFFSNCTGIIIGTFFCTTSLQLLAMKKDATEADHRTRALIELVILVGASIWLALAFVIYIVLDGKYFDTSKLIVGSLCDVTSILYFAAPLSTMSEVIRTKDSISLYPPTIFVNMLNGLMWFFYGLVGVPDMNVWIPNGLGAALAASQLVLIFVYPAKKGEEEKSNEDSSINEGLLEAKRIAHMDSV